LGILSYLVEFYGLKDIIVVFTTTSETGIISISTILSSLMFLNNDEALCISLCLMFEFVTICVIYILLNAFAMSLGLFNILSMQFTVVIVSYDWEFPEFFFFS